MRPETRVGYDYAHAIVDDHSRLAFVELHDDEKAVTVTGFVENGSGTNDASPIGTRIIRRYFHLPDIPPDPPKLPPVPQPAPKPPAA